MTAEQPPGHDPDRAVRDAERAQSRAESRARQQAAYQRAQRASRSRALRAAAGHSDVTPDAASLRASRTIPPPTLPLLRAWLEAEDSRDRPSTEPTAIELVEERLDEAELQQALLEALASLPAEQRVAVVAALGYAEGSVGAAMELGTDPRAAEQLAQQGLDALRHALGPLLTRDE